MTATAVEGASLTGRARRMAVGLAAMTTAGTLLQVAVTAFLGHLGGDALYLRSVYVPFGFVSMAVGEGIAIATQVSASALRRQGDTARIGGVLVLMTVLGVGGFAGLALVVLAGSGPLEAFLAVPAERRDDVRVFLVAVLAANGLTMPPVLAGAALRGTGRATAAAHLAVAATVMTLGAVLATHRLWGLGAMSVPVGLAAGSVPLAVLGGVVLRRGGVVFRWPADPGPALRLLRQVALPVAGSFLVLSGASLGYLWLIRDAGVAGVTGFGLGQTVQLFLIVPAIAIGSAVAITVTLHGGAARANAFRMVLRLALPTYAGIAGAVYLCREPLVDLLTADAAVREVAVDYLGFVGPSLWALGVTLALLTYLEQAGRAVAALVLNVTFFAAVLAVGAALPDPLPAHSLVVLLALANVVGCGCVLLSTRALLRGPEVVAA
ncbi:MATE family efflux transporter [Saccharothrix variisporea]|uniref:Na+-driven multidrug efflux pump n=1 Tax=Saccharothrix variisporea TaxID=543527 RepID=A0A495XKP0_9PSEU|nr:MATE family efflux transporter [Saccharothrix variisporea]RKT74677.1 Na+-driven multidrug efflux pump [Saccharothrix variisporea]